MAQILEYLKDLLHLGREYRTINGHRSALSFYLPKIDGVDVGKHPLVCELLAGVGNVKPPQPRYLETWDVNIVLDFIKGLGSNALLPDKLLTWKTAMLLALAAGARSSEIRLLNTKFMIMDQNRIVFKLVAFTKTRKRGSAIPSLEFSALTTEPSLCVVLCVSQYMSRSKNWRGRSDGVDRHQLLLSMREPHHAVVASTVAGWLKKLMQAAGVDVDCFKPHSIRAASTSKAADKGLAVEEIMERANWSNPSTFKRFYYKPVINKGDKFTKAVLL